MSYSTLIGYTRGGPSGWINRDGKPVVRFPSKEDQAYFERVGSIFLVENPGTTLPLSKEVISSLNCEAFLLKQKTEKSVKDRDRQEAQKYVDRSNANHEMLQAQYASAFRASEEAKLDAERLAAEAREALKRAEQLVLAAKRAEECLIESDKDVKTCMYMLNRLPK
jgi:hypothetical protein